MLFLIKNNIKKYRVDFIISKKIKNISRNKIKNIILKNGIYINNILIYKPNKKINIGDIIKIYIKKKTKKYIPNKNVLLNKVYEDKYLLIINKKKGIIVHPGNKHENDTLLNKLLYKYKYINKITRCGIVHRLDKNVTGLLIIAKKKKSYKKLIKKFKKKKIIRIYKTLVIGNINNKSGKIKTFISRNKYNRTIMCISKTGKIAITKYKIIEKFNYCTFLKIKLETGKTHQIRLHMNYINNPIIGEKIYTKKNTIKKYKVPKIILNKINNFKDTALHASTLIFKHPINNNKIIFNSPLPYSMMELLYLLRNKNN